MREVVSWCFPLVPLVLAQLQSSAVFRRVQQPVWRYENVVRVCGEEPLGLRFEYADGTVQAQLPPRPQ